MQNEITTLLQAIINDYAAWQQRSADKRDNPLLTDVQKKMYTEFAQGLRVETGTKYIKVISKGSVWGFIVNVDTDKKFRKGDILKAAGYNSPARNAARGNILDGDYTIDWTGPMYLR